MKSSAPAKKSANIEWELEGLNPSGYVGDVMDATKNFIQVDDNLKMKVGDYWNWNYGDLAAKGSQYTKLTFVPESGVDLTSVKFNGNEFSYPTDENLFVKNADGEVVYTNYVSGNGYRFIKTIKVNYTKDGEPHEVDVPLAKVVDLILSANLKSEIIWGQNYELPVVTVKDKDSGDDITAKGVCVFSLGDPGDASKKCDLEFVKEDGFTATTDVAEAKYFRVKYPHEAATDELGYGRGYDNLSYLGLTRKISIKRLPNL